MHFCRLAGRIDLPIVYTAEDVAAYLQRLEPGVSRLGLLATTSTVRSRIYHYRLGRSGIEVLVPDDDVQDVSIMTAIRSIKSGVADSTGCGIAEGRWRSSLRQDLRC